MERFIRSGNIVRSHLGTAAGCSLTDYVEFSPEYTSLRKYSTCVRFFNDNAVIYREPTSKAKHPEAVINTDEGDRPEAGREYFIRLCGVGKKSPKPTFYELRELFFDRILVCSKPIADTLRSLSWNRVPGFSPVRLMGASNKVVSDAGEYEMLFPRSRHDVIRETPELVDLRSCILPQSRSESPRVIEAQRAAGFHTNAVQYHHALNDDFLKRGVVYSRFFFSVKALEALLALDPELVFMPVFATDEDIDSFHKRVGEPWGRLNDDAESVRDVLALRDYCQRWCPCYDEDAFTSWLFPTMRWVNEQLEKGIRLPDTPTDPAILG